MANFWRSALIAVCATCGPTRVALSSQEHPATCAGYIGMMDAAARTNDPTGPQAYIDLADRMYKSINAALQRHAVIPLPLPADESSEAQRAMAVVRQCKSNMAMQYHEAVASAYLQMRREAGLLDELPPLQ